MTATGRVTVTPVGNARELRQFVTFPFRRYRGDPSWVPPLIEERLDFLNPRKNPFFDHAQVALFLARRDGEVAGTIGAALDERYAAFQGERMAAFGFFETVDDPMVAAMLLEAAEQFARAQNASLIRGPMSFTTNHELGLLIEGFDIPPMVLMTHNPPSYAVYIESAGYVKSMDLYAYISDLADGWRSAKKGIFRTAERAARADGIRIRPINMHRFADEVQRVKSIYQQSWQRNWGFVPLTDAEADHLAASLRFMIDPDLVRIAETRDGTPIGIAVGLPDLNQALRRSGGGAMFPFGLLHFLWQRRHIDQFRLWIMGVTEAYRGRGIDAAFYVEITRAALAKGYRRAEASWILENNTMMNRILVHLGMHRYKTYRLYEKRLLTERE